MGNYKQEYKGKNILITGGCGCIGSNLVRALLEAGVKKVTILDDLSASCMWNVEGATVIVDSVTSEVVSNILKRDKYDIVFHLAAHFANQNSIDHPNDDLNTNGFGTLNVLEQSRLNGVKRVVYASSGCSVYGSQAPLPLKEDYVSLHLDTPYQIHKLLGELYCNFYINYYKFPVAIARYFNVYGQGEIPGAYRNVIPNFMWRALHKQPLLITGTGEETRDFTYVGDIVDGTMRLGVIPEAVGQAFNLASETETRVIDLANMINELTGNQNNISYIPRRDWDKIIRRRASIEKARKILGYEPKTKVQDGIKEVCQWELDNLEKIKKDAKF
jgi:nucleoside-diphosphate-sugar epimerase